MILKNSYLTKRQWKHSVRHSGWEDSR